MNPLTRFATGALLALGATSATAGTAPPPPSAATQWVASWQASPQPVWDAAFLFPTGIPTALDQQTFRQTARISLGGARLRVRLSNAYGSTPLRIGAVSVGTVPGATPVALSFAGQAGTVIAPGQDVLSDPLAVPTTDGQSVQVSVYVPGRTPLQTFHWDGRQTSTLAPGNQTARAILHDGSSTTARLFLTGIEVDAPTPARSVVVIGDSITDGASASLDRDQRWTDHLAMRLAVQRVAVVNAGISGGRLLRDGMGQSALARLQRDVFDQAGVASVIVLIGINDISWPGTAFARDQPPPTLAELQEGYRRLARRAWTGTAGAGSDPDAVCRRPARHPAGRLLPAAQGRAARPAQRLAAQRCQPVRPSDRPGRSAARSGRPFTAGRCLRLRRPPSPRRCRQPRHGRGGGPCGRAAADAGGCGAVK